MADEGVAPQAKRCKACGEWFPRTPEFFYFKPDGQLAQGRCKRCTKAKQTAYYQTNRKACLEQMAVHRAANREAILARKRAYADRNRAKINAAAAERYRRDQAKILAAQKRRYDQDPAPFRAIMRRVEAKRRATDPHFRLDQGMKRSIGAALRGAKSGRSWETLVGYTLEDLHRHLERQFRHGMSWANYGRWHIDHIVPRAAFRYVTAEDPEFLACWALTNLRPLWKAANLKKRDSREFLL